MRKPIGKRVRFEVFARDGFTCRYCGRQSDKVELVIDHVTPVCQGGGNDPENLVTSCQPCNAGKAGKTVSQSYPNEETRLRLSQEMQEQMALLDQAKQANDAREALSQEVCNYYCQSRGVEDIRKSNLKILVAFVRQHGSNQVFEWIDIASRNIPQYKCCTDFVRYLCGIRRKQLNETSNQVPQ